MLNDMIKELIIDTKTKLASIFNISIDELSCHCDFVLNSDDEFVTLLLSILPIEN